jgi:preprotein translocase subunit SecG
MITVLTVIYVIVCLFLILVVLLQAGKGGGMGSAFGGSGSQTVFGGAGAGNFLTRVTVVCAMLFMMLSATLAYLSSSSEKALERASDVIKLREQARKDAIIKKSAKSKQSPGAESGKPSGDKKAAPSSETQPGEAVPSDTESSESVPGAGEQPSSVGTQKNTPKQTPPKQRKPDRGPWP